MQNVVFIGPHPDDIEIGCGAFVSLLKRKGAKVTFIVVMMEDAGLLKNVIRFLI